MPLVEFIKLFLVCKKRLNALNFLHFSTDKLFKRRAQFANRYKSFIFGGRNCLCACFRFIAARASGYAVDFIVFIRLFCAISRKSCTGGNKKL